MSSITEWLQQQGPEMERHQGVTTIEIADLPHPLRTISRLILRESEMSYPALCAAVAVLPETECVSQAELDEALAALSSQRWLIYIYEGTTLVYKVNLRRRMGRLVKGDIWANLED